MPSTFVSAAKGPNMQYLDLTEVLHVVRRNGALVLRINGSRRELLYFPVDGLAEQTAEALGRDDMETVKEHLIAVGRDFLADGFVQARLLAEAHPPA